MRNTFIAVVLIFFACENNNIGCKNDQTANCGVNDPLTEIEWLGSLKAEVDAECHDVCRTTILRGSYKGQVVFFTQLGGPLCDTFFEAELFNCCQELVKSYGPNDFQLFDAEVTNRTSLYTCTP